MTRIALYALAALLAAAPAVAHADTILNLNATTPGNTVGGIANSLAPSFFATLTLGPGTYDLSVVGTNTAGALYNGWNQSEDGNGLPSNTSWEERIGVDTGYASSFSTTGTQNFYDYADTKPVDQFIFLTGNGSCNQGNCYSSASAALAVFAAQVFQFTLTSATPVTFYIPDTPANTGGNGFADNTGGESLSLTQVTPEPSSLLLLGTGILLAAFFNVRPVRSMNLPVLPEDTHRENPVAL